MAGGDWVKQFVYLEDDPKVIFAAEALSRDRRFLDWLGCPGLSPAVLADVTEALVSRALRRVWGVTRRDGAADGDDVVLRYATLATLDRVTRLPGFGSALEAVGWVVAEPGDRLRFPKLAPHVISPKEKAKEQAAERKRRQREREREGAKAAAEVTRDGHAPVTGQSREVTPLITEQVITEQRREENTPLTPQGGQEAAGRPRAKRPPKPPEAPPALPPPLDTPGFAEAWGRWERHRREIGHPLKPSMRESQLKTFAEWGEARATAAIDFTIFKGWQGLKEPDGPSGNGHAPPDLFAGARAFLAGAPLSIGGVSG